MGTPGRPKKIQEENTAVLDEETKIEEKSKTMPDTNLTEIKTGKVKKGAYFASITTDFYGDVDAFYVTEKDPEFRYHFLREEEKNLSLKTSDILSQKGCWQICPKEYLLQIGITPDRIGEDGRYRKGDLVLAFMPKELYALKEEYKRKERMLKTNQIKRMIGDPDNPVERNRIAGEGIPELARMGHNTIRGIETKKQLGM